ncbi:hypothetical protein [Sorangium sp. So ce1389]|uniref:hypothetical protein n=1 Tax=Sorangium sp. So ce1389 TaxID=3133336 RepID=UPI003F603A6A
MSGGAATSGGAARAHERAARGRGAGATTRRENGHAHLSVESGLARGNIEERAVSDVTCGVMREARSAALPAARTRETSLQCSALSAIAIAAEQAGADPGNAGVRRSPQRALEARAYPNFVNEFGHLYGPRTSRSAAHLLNGRSCSSLAWIGVQHRTCGCPDQVELRPPFVKPSQDCGLSRRADRLDCQVIRVEPFQTKI